MRRITEHNYEEFAIDYMVGDLSASKTEEFTSFLGEHPDIADEILLFENSTTIKCHEPKSFNNLKRDISQQGITEDNFEEYCIASIEKDLSPASEAKLNEYIGTNAKRLATKTTFEQTKLIPEELVYPHKDALKKTVRKPLFKQRWISISTAIVAASIVAFGFFLTPSEQKNAPVELANNTPTVVNEAHQETTKEAPKAAPIKQVILAKAKKETPTKHTATRKTETSPSSVTKQEGINNTHEILEKLKSKRTNAQENTYSIGEKALALSTPRIQTEKEPLSDGAKLRNKTNKLLYTKVFAQSVKSLNRMAETELGYDVIEDEEGNPVRIIIKSRFGEIDRALAQR